MTGGRKSAFIVNISCKKRFTTGKNIGSENNAGGCIWVKKIMCVHDEIRMVRLSCVKRQSMKYCVFCCVLSSFVCCLLFACSMV